MLPGRGKKYGFLTLKMSMHLLSSGGKMKESFNLSSLRANLLHVELVLDGNGRLVALKITVGIPLGIVIAVIAALKMYL
jgi:hypothetical protein